MEDYELSKLKSLITHAKLLVRKNSEILEATGGKFNIFRVCGVDHYETIHSAIIAEFLDPEGSHGLKDKFLQAFFDKIKSSEKLKDAVVLPEKNCRVKTEHKFDDGRIDIYVENHVVNGAIVIENKIYANDQDQQLVRYYKYIKSKTPHGLYYLTLEGSPPTEQSIKFDGCCVPFFTISYREHILGWIETCICIAAEFPLVRETLRQYKNHIMELLEMNTDKEVQDLANIVCQNRDAYVAARKIVSSWPAIQMFLLNNSIKPLINETVAQFLKTNLKLSVDFEFSEAKDSGFSVHVEDYEYYIRFVFEETGYRQLFVGIPRKSSHHRKGVLSQAPKGYEGAGNDWWICWKWAPLEFRSWNDVFFADAIDKEPAKSAFKSWIEECLKELLPVICKITSVDDNANN